MRPQSAKSKGRRFQQYCRDILLKAADSLEPDDIRSTSMGAAGEDILFSPAARRVYPYSVECKNVEKLSIWGAIEQAVENCGKYIPVVMFKKNNHRAWIAIPLDSYMEIAHGVKKDEF